MIFCTMLHLDESKKCSKRIFEKKYRFRDFGQKWPILPFLAIFSQKIKFLDYFFESAHQICLKLGQKPGRVALNHLMAVLYLGKFLFWPFWPFLGQKYIACDIMWFWAVFGHFLPNRWWFYVNFCYLSLSLLFENGQWNFFSDKKLGAIFLSFFGPDLAIFAQKSGFRTFSSNLHIRFV